jgi:hypothetical protein
LGGRPAIPFRDRLNRSLYRLLHLAPFRTERDPVSPDEWLLRRVPRAADYFDPAGKVPLSPLAFASVKQDTDGISLFRELFTSARALSATGRKPPYYVVRIRASDVNALALSLQPSPDAEQPEGHVVIPELCYRPKPTVGQKEAALRLRIALRDLARLAVDPNTIPIVERIRALLRGISAPALVLMTVCGAP